MTLHWSQINSLSQSSYNQMLIENAEYIILCIFGDRIMSSFKVIEEGIRSSPSVRRKQKEAMSE